jgi:hypothetical protein
MAAEPPLHLEMEVKVLVREPVEKARAGTARADRAPGTGRSKRRTRLPKPDAQIPPHHNSPSGRMPVPNFESSFALASSQPLRGRKLRQQTRATMRPGLVVDAAAGVARPAAGAGLVEQPRDWSPSPAPSKIRTGGITRLVGWRVSGRRSRLHRGRSHVLLTACRVAMPSAVLIATGRPSAASPQRPTPGRTV